VSGVAIAHGEGSVGIGQHEGPPAFVIGLVNNMPDAALQATEQQFRRLLEAAAAGRKIELHLIALAEVPRGPVGQRLLEQRYEGPDILQRVAFDGLIVTGTEPRSPRLDQEPYWDSFVALTDWARDHTVSTIWSCLAAHAAVLRLDGIERRRFPEKLFGLYACQAQVRHAMSDGLGAGRRVPHSRFNDLPEEELRRADYEVLARSDATGADFFVKEYGSLFVFLQGHPEYDRHALMREYRRDVGRYLSGERDAYPNLPHEYFDATVRAELAAFAGRALATRDPGLLAQFPRVDEGCPPHEAWRTDADRIYANWLALIEQRRACVSRDARVPARHG
jgi:homoserine O-succinyltransferase